MGFREYSVMKLRQLIEKYCFFLNILIFILNIVILATLIYGFLKFSHNVLAFSSELAIQRIGDNLGISPDWQSFGGYIKDTFHDGMSREEVFKELDKIGAYTIRRVDAEDYAYCEIIEFHGITNYTHYPIWFCYENMEIEVLGHFSIAIDD